MKFLLVLGIGVVLVGSSYILLVLLGRRKHEHLGTWPTTTGTVKASFVYKHTPRLGRAPTYTPVVRYTYTVDGETYTSETLTMTPGEPLTFRDEQKAHAVVAKYPPKSTVDVGYNPQSPTQASLTRRKPTGFNTGLFTGLANVAIGAVLIALYALL
jgi:hypothetical protein